MTRRHHRYAELGCLILGSGWLCLQPPEARANAGPAPAEDDLFRPGAIPRLRIDLDAAAAASLRADPREFVAATVTAGTEVYPQVALHLKGSTGSFRAFDNKPALTLDFSRFQNGRKFHGLRRFHLNNSVEDPSYVNEAIGSEFFLAVGLPAPRVTRALVCLNGGAAKLYVLKEGFTEDFLARHFHRLSGELYEPGEGRDVDGKLARNSVEAPFDRSRAALKRLAAAAGEADPAQRWRELDTALDTRRFLTFMAAEVLLGHRDGYCVNRNNYRLYHDLDGGKMVFFPHGMDQLFGTADFPWQPQWAGMVAQAVMDTDEGRQGYRASFGALLTNQFNVEKWTRRVDELVGELRPVLNPDEYDGVQAAAEVVKERIAKRKVSLLAQFNRPALTPLEFTADGARPQGWEVAERPAQGTIDRVECDGRAALHIAAQGDTLASWRAVVLLEPGHYRFTDRIRLAGVQPLSSGARSGARLRVGRGPWETQPITGDLPWRELATDFQVGPVLAPVELICELRARAGEVWYDLPAMRVSRIEKMYEN